MERIDRLWPDGPQFLFDDALFRPSTDSFLLGYFTRTRRGDRVCDLGAGTGLLGLLLLARQPELTVTGIELRQDACTLARRTAQLNGLDSRLNVQQGDLRDYGALPGVGTFDAVVSNPPYFAAGSGVVSPDHARGTARAELTCTLADVCAAASRLLRSGGRFSLVLRPDRMAELIALLHRHSLEPKRLRFVQHTVSSAPSLLLLECRKDGHAGLTAEPVLLLKDAEGRDTAEADLVYFRNS